MNIENVFASPTCCLSWILTISNSFYSLILCFEMWYLVNGLEYLLEIGTRQRKHLADSYDFVDVGTISEQVLGVGILYCYFK